MKVFAIQCAIIGIFYLILGYPLITGFFILLLMFRVLAGPPANLQAEQKLLDLWNRDPRVVMVGMLFILGAIAIFLSNFYIGLTMCLLGSGILIFI